MNVSGLSRTTQTSGKRCTSSNSTGCALFACVVVTMPRIDGSKEKFENSVSKALLRIDILQGRVTDATSPKAAYDLHPEEHHKWKYQAWCGAMKRLLAAVDRDQDRMQWDVLSYGHDIAIIQAQRSEPADAAWHRSPAYRLLKQDIDDRKNEQLAPKELWMSRPEYQAFDLQCFRKHIYQEVDSRPKRAILFEKKKKGWLYPELHKDHPRLHD